MLLDIYFFIFCLINFVLFIGNSIPRPPIHLLHRINTLGYNCVQKFYLGRYMVGYTVGNSVHDFRTSNDIRHQIKILNNFIPILMYFLNFTHQKRNVRCLRDVKPSQRPITIDVVHDVGFPTIYCKIYCRKFLRCSFRRSQV